jgi:V8-like Glu-specific endopeptidase
MPRKAQVIGKTSVAGSAARSKPGARQSASTLDGLPRHRIRSFCLDGATVPRSAVRSSSALRCLLGACLLAGAIPLHAQPADAATARATPQRLGAEQLRIGSRTLLERARRPAAEAQPVEITRQGERTVIQAADRAVMVANPGVVGQQIRQLPVDAVLEPAPGNSVRIRRLDLQATSAWNRLDAGRKSRYRRVDAAQRQMARAAEQALAPDAGIGDLQQLQSAVDATQRTIVAAYAQLPAQERAEQRMLVEQHREVRRASKALYGLNRDDRYPPQAYERIYENSHASFAFKRRDEDTPRCSAVLIGQRYGLTNNHCVLDEAPDEFVAVFDYEDDLDGQHRPTQVFPVADILLEDDLERGGLDFVLLELGENADGELPGARYRPQCLSLAPVKRDDPLYVVGYPQGEPRTVHDNAFVYFPHVVSAAEHAELEILVRSEFDTLEAEDQSYREGKLKEFTDSYRQREVDGAIVFEYISTRFGNQPTIGADSDTYRGNSGSPVYNRRSHAVIGLLFDGQDDLSQPWEPGWRAHEAILPITEVVRQLDVAKADWKDDPQVCIKAAT